MAAPSIAFFDAKVYDRESFDAVNRAFGFGLKYFDDHLTPDTAILAKGADTVCAFVNDKITAGTVDTLAQNGVKLIAMRCAGYNNIDLKAAYGKIHVVRVPSYSPNAVAEHAVALMLTLNRKIHRAYFRTRDANFTLRGLLGFDMAGKTAGIVGTGQIGRVLAKILIGFGMRVLAYDLMPNQDEARKIGYDYTDLNTIYKEAHIISLHCPLTKDTHHMINKDTIAKMRQGVMIINTGRGALIDSKDLIDFLKSGHIGSAGLDVYEEESEYFFEDFSNSTIEDDTLARLLSFNNVVVTSHQAFFTAEALHNIAETTLGNIGDFFENRPLKNSICFRCGNDCARKKTGRCF